MTLVDSQDYAEWMYFEQTKCGE